MKNKAWIVFRGHVPGVYTRFAEARKQTLGYSKFHMKAYRSFDTAQETWIDLYPEPEENSQEKRETQQRLMDNDSNRPVSGSEPDPASVDEAVISKSTPTDSASPPHKKAKLEHTSSNILTPLRRTSSPPPTIATQCIEDSVSGTNAAPVVIQDDDTGTIDAVNNEVAVMEVAEIEVEDDRELMQGSLISGPTITLFIGPQEYPFVTHKKLICHHSKHFAEYFEAEEDEDSDRDVDYQFLPNATVEVLKMYVNWLYTGKLFDSDTPFTKERVQDYAQSLLIKLWVFANGTMIPAIQNAALRSLQKTIDVYDIIPYSSTKYIFDNTCHNSPLRDWIVAQIIWRLGVQSMSRRNMDLIYHPKAMLHVLREVQKLGQSIHDTSEKERALSWKNYKVSHLTYDEEIDSGSESGSDAASSSDSHSSDHERL